MHATRQSISSLVATVVPCIRCFFAVEISSHPAGGGGGISRGLFFFQCFQGHSREWRPCSFGVLGSRAVQSCDMNPQRAVVSYAAPKQTALKHVCQWGKESLVRRLAQSRW